MVKIALGIIGGLIGYTIGGALDQKNKIVSEPEKEDKIEPEKEKENKNVSKGVDSKKDEAKI